jgi:pimeloyl-ACP methyl ester carboxylesterase
MASLSEREERQVEQANMSARVPVVFVHGLWLLASSWDRWAELFEQAGYAAVAADWPGDTETVEQARAHPEALAGKGIGEVAEHVADVIGRLTMKPAVVGHSFGGLLAQIVAGRGLAAVSVAVDPAPFRGVLALPVSALRAGLPALRNPANRKRAVALTYDEFRYSWGNALPEQEARQLHETYSVPGPGAPLFEAASANLNPWTAARVDTHNPDRGPLLIISGQQDHTIPWAIANGSYKRQRRNASVTEIIEIPGRGHSLTIDSGWREVAETALAFVRRFVS